MGNLLLILFIFAFRHLDGSTLPTALKPSVLIVDSSQILITQLSKKNRDEDFINLVLSNLRAPNGNVLIPVEPTGRLLEILLLLESRWHKNRYPYPIYLVGSKSDMLVDYIKSMLEWMSENMTKSFTANRENPFDFK